MKSLKSVFATACLGLVFVISAASASAADRPNIIIILADDMGFSDISCYGSEIPTPNLDALAADGLRYTQFYNTGRCFPTRASLISGLYAHQAGMGAGNLVKRDPGVPGYIGHLSTDTATIPEVLNGAGYFTAMAGKWHLGNEPGQRPAGRGFQRSINSAGGGFYYQGRPRSQLYIDGKAVRKGDPRVPDNWYSTDLWTDYGIQFIDEAREAKKPFFLYIAHNAPHFPLQAPAEDIARFRGKYRAGWDKLRAERLIRQRNLGLFDADTGLSPRAEEVAAWDALTPIEQNRFDEIMSIYAACVWHMDQQIGRLVAALKERGELDNTLILFCSDNGGNAEGGPNGFMLGKNPGDPLSEVYAGEGWANFQNTPFRLFKHFNHEGGIATPLIAHWPAGFSAKGEWRTQPAHVIDFMATAIDLAHATYPKMRAGEKVQPFEGKSLRPTFSDPDQAIERDGGLFWEHEGNAAMRDGDWKLVRRGPIETGGQNGPWELYDMARDRSELNDLATAEPARLKAMTNAWQAWALRAKVLPKSAGKDMKDPWLYYRLIDGTEGP